MHLIPRFQITIPADRQRGTPSTDDVAALADSIRQHGLFHPPVVEVGDDNQWILLAGHTRLLALDLIAAEGDSIACGNTTVAAGHVPCTTFDELTPLQRCEIELEENVRRRDLPWQKQVDAYARVHALKLASGMSYREALAATEALASPDTVLKPHRVHKNILLGQHLSDPEVSGAVTKEQALKIIERKLRKASDLAAPEPVGHSLALGDALAFLRSLPDSSADGILTDPPYGISIEQMSYQKSSEQVYDDSYATWFPLMEGLFARLTRVLKPNAVGYLFCDFARFEELVVLSRKYGFEPYARPMIWNKAPDGRLPAPEKWPRRCYECILYFRRGIAPLREFRPDVLSYPADRDTENYHGAKKPVPLLLDLIERAWGPGSTILDPFAGSGSTLLAARQAKLTCLGAELDPQYHALALRRLAGPAALPDALF